VQFTYRTQKIFRSQREIMQSEVLPELYVTFSTFTL